jgi:hypothetical protein
VTDKLEAAVFAPDVRLGAPPNYGIAGEPSVAVAPDGTYYVSAPLIDLTLIAGGITGTGSFGQGRVWASSDGATFHLLNGADGYLEHTQKQGGNGDTDIAVDATGRVHFVDLGAGIPYLTSDDQGGNWTDRGNLSKPSTSVDRQWISVKGETVAVSWRDFNVNPASIRAVVSTDRGETWADAVDVAPDGLGGPIVLAPNGMDVYLPYVGSSNVVTVGVSHDGGKTWKDSSTKHVLPAPSQDPVEGATSLLFPVLDVDAAGNVFLVWSEYRADGTAAVHLMRSTDRAATWTDLAELSPPNGNDVFPWVAAGDAGRVAVVFLRSNLAIDPQVGPHQWHLVESASIDALAAKPTWSEALVTPNVVHTGAICMNGGGCGAIVDPVYGDRTLLDFIECAIAPDGSVAVSWTETHEQTARNPELHFGHQTAGTVMHAPKG